jgi:hypothetical protein
MCAIPGNTVGNRLPRTVKALKKGHHESQVYQQNANKNGDIYRMAPNTDLLGREAEATAGQDDQNGVGGDQHRYHEHA